MRIFHENWAISEGGRRGGGKVGGICISLVGSDPTFLSKKITGNLFNFYAYFAEYKSTFERTNVTSFEKREGGRVDGWGKRILQVHGYVRKTIDIRQMDQ